MSSGSNNVFESLFKLWASICKMILDGARKAEEVAKYLQRVNDDPNFLVALERPAQASVNTDTFTADWWDKFLSMMISACGFVSYVNPNINGKNFPYRDGDLEPKQVETLSIKQKLRELGRPTMSTQEVKDYIDSMCYRSATLVELLWWWLKFYTFYPSSEHFSDGI